MHSNDQLFGLRLGFLGGPSSSRSDMKSILTLRRHQRVHWLNHRLFNCSSLLTQQTSTELWKEFFNVAVHQQAAPFEKVKRRISQYHWGGDGCHKRELNTDRNRRLNVRETDAAGSSYHRVFSLLFIKRYHKRIFFCTSRRHLHLPRCRSKILSNTYQICFDGKHQWAEYFFFLSPKSQLRSNLDTFSHSVWKPHFKNGGKLHDTTGAVTKTAHWSNF